MKPATPKCPAAAWTPVWCTQACTGASAALQCSTGLKPSHAYPTPRLLAPRDWLAKQLLAGTEQRTGRVFASPAHAALIILSLRARLTRPGPQAQMRALLSPSTPQAPVRP